LTEDGLAQLGYSDTIVLRPALIEGTAREPEKVRIVEKMLE